MIASEWESKGVWIIRAYSHKSWGKSTDAFNIEKRKFYLKHEPRGENWDISGWTSGNFSCLVQKKNRAGPFQVREIFWETFNESISCPSFKSGDRDMTKNLMNKLRESLFWKSTENWDNNIFFSVRINLENFESKIAKIVPSLLEWYQRTTLRVNKVVIFKRFRCNLLKTNIKLEGTWWYSVGRATWTIINWSNCIYNWTVRKAI